RSPEHFAFGAQIILQSRQPGRSIASSEEYTQWLAVDLATLCRVLGRARRTTTTFLTLLRSSSTQETSAGLSWESADCCRVKKRRGELQPTVSDNGRAVQVSTTSAIPSCEEVDRELPFAIHVQNRTNAFRFLCN